MQIQPGDYVAVSDITCEAIHAAVVKCFEAAGYKKYEGHVIGVPLGKGVGIGADEFKHIESLGRGSAQRQLTLQQLFTATNSIRWPDWATEVRLYLGTVYFHGEGIVPQAIVSAGHNTSQLDSVTLTTRNPVSDSTIRPAPETGWYDWSVGRARELPPVGEVVEYNTDGADDWIGCRVVAHDDSLAIIKYNNAYIAARTHELRPSNYTERKAELARERVVNDALDWGINQGFNISKVELYAYYDACFLRSPI